MQVPEEEQAPSPLHLPNKDSSVFRGQSYLFFKKHKQGDKLYVISKPADKCSRRQRHSNCSSLLGKCYFFSVVKENKHHSLLIAVYRAWHSPSQGSSCYLCSHLILNTFLPAHWPLSSPSLKSGMFAVSVNQHWKAKVSSCMYFFPFLQVLAK